MTIRVRYDTPDENGETRRTRNERFDQPSPTLIIPRIGLYLWKWYFSISDQLRRCRDGWCEPIAPSEFIAWKLATGNIVYAREYATLCAMDAAFCSEMNKELADLQVRQNEKAAKPDNSSRRGRLKGR